MSEKKSIFHFAMHLRFAFYFVLSHEQIKILILQDHCPQTKKVNNLTPGWFNSFENQLDSLMLLSLSRFLSHGHVYLSAEQILLSVNAGFRDELERRRRKRKDLYELSLFLFCLNHYRDRIRQSYNKVYLRQNRTHDWFILSSVL